MTGDNCNNHVFVSDPKKLVFSNLSQTNTPQILENRGKYKVTYILFYYSLGNYLQSSDHKYKDTRFRDFSNC